MFIPTHDNPHLAAKHDSDKPVHTYEDIRRLNRQYTRRQRYQKKYGQGSMRSLRQRYKRFASAIKEGMSFREWLRKEGEHFTKKFSPKAARIRKG